jgi:uncharacterized delta-60 repeat protein
MGGNRVPGPLCSTRVGDEWIEDGTLCNQKLREPDMRKLISLVLTVVLIVPSPLSAADGDLDPTFGVGGIVITDFSGGDDYAFTLVLQPDAKIVAAGHTSSGFALARYNSDGSLDTSFGSGGKVVTTFSGGATAVAIQSDGKIVAAGGSLLVRYYSDGTLDTTFGTGGKVVQTGFGGFSVSIVLQSDGKIVTAGAMFAPADFALARYNGDGSLDTTFGSGGLVTTDFSGRDDEASASLLQADGKIVAAGRTTSTVGTVQGSFALARYNTDGSLDTTFGTAGRVITSFAADDASVVETLILQPDGKIVAGGGRFIIEEGLRLARYNSDGSLDPTFGVEGKIYDVLSGVEAKSLALQPDGKIIAASYPFVSDIALARYNPDGSLDPTFGVNGYVSGDGAWAIVLQLDGKIVAAGQVVNPDDFMVARYNNSGRRRSPRQITSN